MFDLRSLVSVPFLVIGGVATRLYAPERMTDDLDVLIAAKNAEVFSEELAQSGVGENNPWMLPNGTILDVLEEDNAWVEEAMARPEA